MSDRRPSIAKFAAVLALLSLTACARPIGDFGRAEDPPTPPAIESIHTMVSTLNWSDEEIEMRDRIWRFLVSPHGYDWLGDTVTEVTRLGFAKAQYRPRAKDGYYRWLTTTTFASSAVRYARLDDDIDANIGTLPATFLAICAVERVDHQRGIAANGLPDTDPKMRTAAEARQVENRAAIAWFMDSVDARYDAYSFALDNLLMDTPHDAALRVDAKLSAMKALVETADEEDYCSHGGRHATSATRTMPVGSRRYPVGIVAGS